PSTSESKDEHYYERRKRNNDASKKSREKRRMNDMAMEQRLLQLTKENNLLKSRLESQHRVNNQAESVIVAGPSVLAHPTPTAPAEISMDQSSSMLPHLFINPYLQSAVQAPVSAPSIQSSTGSAFTAPSSVISGTNGSSALPNAGSASQSNGISGYGAFAPYGSLPKLDLATSNLPTPMSIFPPHFFNANPLLTAANGGLNGAAGAMPLSLHSLSTLHAALQQHGGQAYRSATSALFPSDGGAFQPFSAVAAAAAASQQRIEGQSSTVESTSRTSPPSEPSQTASRKRESEEKRQGSPDSSSDKDLISSTSTRMPQDMPKGPGNLRFVGQLPTAQEPRPSVLSHIANSSQFWPSSSALPTSTIVPTSTAFSSTTEPQLPPTAALNRTTPNATGTLGVLVNGHSSSTNFPASVGPSAFDGRIVSTMSTSSDRSHPSLLGSLLSATRRSPSVPESRTERQSGLSGGGRREEDSELKNCLSTLNVHLSTSTTSSFSSSSANNGGAKSDSDSLGSPQSTKSTTDSNRSQSSPTHATNSSNSPNDGSKGRPDMERYMDRRRRNNEAAKRCRANRRAVFEYRSRRAQQLEIENGELRQEMIKLNNELEQLKAIIAANSRLLSNT
ncbi:CRE-ATF-2 protein, partial [Aphelenchoides avenae]